MNEIKFIQKSQKAVAAGDICPRCGRPVMLGGDKDSVLPNGIKICNSCYFDHTLLASVGIEEEQIKTWAIFDNTKKSIATKDESNYVVIPKFKPGDRGIDTRSDWPITILEILQDGLYLARCDGESKANSVFKDREIVFNLTGMASPQEYIQLIRDRCWRTDKDDSHLCYIHKIRSNPGMPGNGIIGRIISVQEDGSLSVQTESDEILIYPDTDLFSLIDDNESAKQKETESKTEEQIDLSAYSLGNQIPTIEF